MAVLGLAGDLAGAGLSGGFWSQFQQHPTSPGLSPGTLPTPGGQPSTQPVTPPNGTPTQPVSGASGGGSGQDPQTLIKQWQASHQPGQPGASMQDLVAYLQQNGVNAQVATHAGGTQLSGDKIVLPDSSVIDLVSNEGGSDASWSYSPDGYFVNGQPSTTPASVGLTPPPADGSGGSGSAGGSGFYGLSNGQGFAPPTAQDALNSPGLQFALQQGEKGLANSAFAQGAGLTGGTLKSLANYDIGTALQGYQQVFNNQLAGAQFNAGNLTNLANIGESAAAGSAANGANYAGQAGQTAQGIGNAQAAGSIAQGNAFANGLTGASNNILNSYLLSQLKGLNPGTGA
jgi:hypothetical protein